jgi:hypothetical protein
MTDQQRALEATLRIEELLKTDGTKRYPVFSDHGAGVLFDAATILKKREKELDDRT